MQLQPPYLNLTKTILRVILVTQKDSMGGISFKRPHFCTWKAGSESDFVCLFGLMQKPRHNNVNNYGRTICMEDFMKLAEALQERADLNTKISQLRSRLENNALVQEGEKPAENPDELLVELDDAILRLETLMTKINLTNCRTVSDGKSITELIARKDTLRLRLEAYRNLVNVASQNTRRATRTEIKILSTVDVKSLQKKSDLLAKELRRIDNSIQELNWQTELL